MSTQKTDLAGFKIFTPGEEAGVSPWVRVDQDMISGLGRCTPPLAAPRTVTIPKPVTS